MTFLDFLPQSKAEAVSDIIAVGAVTSPLWLHEIAGIAKDLLPIAGVLWLAIQAWIKIQLTYWKKK